MKKIIVLCFVLGMLGIFQESKAQFSVGPGMTYATDINSLGLSANLAYDINETWRATGGFTYFFEKDMVKWTAFDFNANYNFTEIDNLGMLYGIAGINITRVKVDVPIIGGSVSDSNAGLNIGAGLNINLSEKIDLSPEMVYTVIDGSYLRIGAKIMFKI